MWSIRGILAFTTIALIRTGVGPVAVPAAEIRAADPDALARAITGARPGDTILMADGTWRDARVVFAAEGETGRPVTLRAATPGKVVLSGGSRLQIGGHDLVVEGLLFRDGGVTSGNVIEFRRSASELATRCRVTQCAIVGYSPPDIKADSKWVSIYGRSNRVDHCYFAGKTNAGTTLIVWVDDQPNQHTIDYNHFGPRPRLGANGGETIRVGDSKTSMNVSGTLVENNLFEKCDGEIEVISNKSCENTYRYNTFMNCSATLCLRHGNRCLVEGNFFLGNQTRGSGGVRVIGEGHRVVNNYFSGLEGDESRSAIALTSGVENSPLNGYFPVNDAVIAFNTLVANKSNLAIGVAEGKKNIVPPQDCVVANNIVVGRKGPLVHEFMPATRLKWEGNLFFGAELGIATRPGVILADPRLAEGPDHLWRPTGTSPALRAAVGDFGLVRQDIDGQIREGKPDIGCDQRSGRAIVHRPLAPGAVGPSWRREGSSGAGG